MLPAGNRLRRSSDFAAVIRGGRRVGRGTLVVHATFPLATGVESLTEQPGSVALPGCSASPPATSSAGFVVSKAVGGAVVRNTVKRRLRHLVATRLDSLPIGTTIVVRALPAAALAAYSQLELDLDAALAAAQRPRKSDRAAR
ncbi:ribonuclease P protein component [Allocatelliglobosispora scoriae]|uniref:ribonuclease P protein component n=1 Tax=Allocatelliglobosispora scoriae TaxID=643052 RepID=UPI0016161364|nr:ribonuclease P protein component [Allocatelliglobosispora scoriae]